MSWAGPSSTYSRAVFSLRACPLLARSPIYSTPWQAQITYFTYCYIHFTHHALLWGSREGGSARGREMGLHCKSFRSPRLAASFFLPDRLQNLSDFKSRSCWTPFSYFFLLFFLVISFAVYAVDTFTAVNLLAFSRWSGEIEPAIPFKISRWIFTVCILLSFALLIVRWVFAIRAMRSGSIAESYLNSLAVRVESIRVGKARGWKRFLVFAELTKSRKGVEYVALFVYFSFECERCLDP